MKQFTCIVCPVGCAISCADDGTISGNKCDRGKNYVLTEISNPVRMVTSTVSTVNGTRCPVRTSKPVPKSKIFDVMNVIRGIDATLPISVGDVMVKNIAGTEADLVATANIG